MKKPILLFSALLTFAASGGVELYVSPAGSDAASGTRSAPLATLQGARDKLRALRSEGKLAEGAEVIFKEGRYPQRVFVEFTAEDSGTAEGPIVFKAARGAEVRFTGGVELPPFRPLSNEPAAARIQSEVRPHIRTLNLKAAGITDFGKEPSGSSSSPASGVFLVYNDDAAVLPRWPKKGQEYLKIAGVVTNDTFVYADDRISKWAEESDPRGQGWWAHDWATAAIAFKHLDPVAKTITQIKPGSGYGFRKSGVWYGYNLLCELSEPGEYYLDRTDGTIYFYPPDDAGTKRAEAAVAWELVKLNGVSNIKFEKIVFENCRAQAVMIKDGENVGLIGCTLRNIGFRAVTIQNGKNHRIAGCEMYSLRDGGIFANAGKPDTLEHCGHVFENNHIHDYARFCLAYGAAIQFHGCGFTVSRNLIHNGPHVAVLFHGRENVMSGNEIHSVCLVSGEMGAFYCGRDWTLVGNVISGNYIHDIYNPRRQRNRAIMLDDGAGGITMTDNLIVRVAEGISLSAYGNVISNNAFIGCHPAISGWQTYLTPASVTPPKGVHEQMPIRLFALKPWESPWKEKYPELDALAQAVTNGTMRPPLTRTQVCNNLVWGGSTNWLVHFRNYPYSPDAWLVTNNVVGIDPVFRDAEQGDYRMSRKSPALKAGFHPLPAKMGLYKSDERAVWPVHHVVTIITTNLVSEGN